MRTEDVGMARIAHSSSEGLPKVVLNWVYSSEQSVRIRVPKLKSATANEGIEDIPDSVNSALKQQRRAMNRMTGCARVAQGRAQRALPTKVTPRNLRTAPRRVV